MPNTIASAMRNTPASFCGLAPLPDSAIYDEMIESFDPDAFLQQVLANAGGENGGKAAMARALDNPSPRISEFFRPTGQRKRALTMRDGLILAAAFNVDLPPPFQRLSAESLEAVLPSVLRYLPASWTDRDIQRLAKDILIALEIQHTLQASQTSPDQNGQAQKPDDASKRGGAA